MKVPKFLSAMGIVTTLSLLYVYQQTEIFNLAYLGQKKQAFCEDLLDKNTVLRYNIKKSASLIRIGNKIFSGTDFQMPDGFQVVRLEKTQENFGASRRLPNRETILSRLFSIKRRAEAKTISP